MGRLIIRKLWKLMWGQWTHISRIKHYGGSLGDITKATFLDAEPTAEHRRVIEQLTLRYKAYFESNLDSLLEISLICRENRYRLIKTARKKTQSNQYTILSYSKPLRSWLVIQSTTSTNTNITTSYQPQLLIPNASVTISKY